MAIRAQTRSISAFTISELLVAILIIGVLAALLLVGLGKAKDRSRRMLCLNNLRQVDLGVRMYCDDAADTTPSSGATNGVAKMPPWIAYKEFIKSYAGAPNDSNRIFECPADTFYYAFGIGLVMQSHFKQAMFDYSSFTFNGMNQMHLPANITPVPGTHLKTWPGIAGVKLSDIRHPARTVMIAESPAFYPYSWHEPGPAPTNNRVLLFNNAKNDVGFVDGHVEYISIYRQEHITNGGIQACCADPPSGYDYQWSPD